MTIDNLLPRYEDDHFTRIIVNDLMHTPKQISSMFFYDEHGSKLFEKITQIPEYYPTRIEKSLLTHHARAIIPSTRPVDIIELGSGDCSKISILLEALSVYDHPLIRYIPVDISESAVRESADCLRHKYPEISIHGMIMNFLEHIHKIPSENPRLICFFGSTLGNLTPDQAQYFFRQVGQIMNPKDQFLLGVDMVKPADILEQAYNDSANVTASFNQNILRVVNRLSGTDFQPEQFTHQAFYNPVHARIEMHLRADQDMTVTSPALTERLVIKKGELIHTENSHKYTMNNIQTLADMSQLTITDVYSDLHHWFCLVRLTKRPEKHNA
jgi:L-histidine N-alpha-methyltransferase